VDVTIARASRMNERWVSCSSSFVFEVVGFCESRDDGREDVGGG
jgi:hypothetical protein